MTFLALYLFAGCIAAHFLTDDSASVARKITSSGLCLVLWPVYVGQWLLTGFVDWLME